MPRPSKSSVRSRRDNKSNPVAEITNGANPTLSYQLDQRLFNSYVKFAQTCGWNYPAPPGQTIGVEDQLLPSTPITSNSVTRDVPDSAIFVAMSGSLDIEATDTFTISSVELIVTDRAGGTQEAQPSLNYVYNTTAAQLYYSIYYGQDLSSTDTTAKALNFFGVVLDTSTAEQSDTLGSVIFPLSTVQNLSQINTIKLTFNLGGNVTSLNIFASLCVGNLTL